MPLSDILKEFFPGQSPTEESLSKLVGVLKEAPSAKDVYGQLKGTGAATDDIVKALEQMSYNLGRDRIVREGLFPKRMLADPMSSGYVMRAAKEYENYAKQLSRNKKLGLAAGIAGLLGYGAYNLFSDSAPEMPNPQQLMQRYSSLLEEGIANTIKKRSALDGVAAIAMFMSL